MTTLNSIFVGKAVNGTAYLKDGVNQVEITTSGLIGDGRGYKGHIKHAQDRVILHVNTEIYDEFRKLGFESKRFGPGGIGENFSTEGNEMTANNTCIGDVYAIGDVKIQITQPRFPCAKNEKFHECKGLSRIMLKHTLGGWFYRVIEEGTVSKGDSITLIERKYPHLSVKTVNDMVFNIRKTPALIENLKKIVDIPELAEELRDRIKKRIGN